MEITNPGRETLVGLVDDLERLGLAERRRSDADRRIQAIHLTDKGRTVLAQALEVAEAENARTFGVLDESERELLHELLLRVADASAD
jgi:DNA-binding MarR family transcriptional regulator